jgi:hypothetical protein
MPKSVVMPIFKVMNSNGEEQFLEQMLIQSMVGYQFENLKKTFQPIVIPLRKFENPPEVQCLGFNLTNAMVKVNRGFLQVNANYIKISGDQVDRDFCEEFEARINKSPQEIFQKLMDNPIFDNPMANKLIKQTQQDLDDAAEKNTAPIDEL